MCRNQSPPKYLLYACLGYSGIYRDRARLNPLNWGYTFSNPRTAPSKAGFMDLNLHLKHGGGQHMGTVPETALPLNGVAVSDAMPLHKTFMYFYGL